MDAEGLSKLSRCKRISFFETVDQHLESRDHGSCLGSDNFALRSEFSRCHDDLPWHPCEVALFTALSSYAWPSSPYVNARPPGFSASQLLSRRPSSRPDEISPNRISRHFRCRPFCRSCRC